MKFKSPEFGINEMIENLHECADWECYNEEQVSWRWLWTNIANHLEKYRWHDLRKNPDDLPERDSRIIFSISDSLVMASEYKEYKEFKCYTGFWVEGLRVFANDDVGYCTKTEYLIGEVEGWRYIEPFKEDTE